MKHVLDWDMKLMSNKYPQKKSLKFKWQETSTIVQTPPTFFSLVIVLLSPAVCSFQSALNRYRVELSH